MADYNINAVTRRVVYTGSAGLGPYAFTFEILDQNDIAVYFNTTKLTLTTDYTVTINANGTGSITIVTGSGVPSTPTASDTITIVGARDIERTTDFVTAGDLRAAALNEQLDGLTIFDQQLAEENKRTLKAPVTDPAHVDEGGTLDMTLPSKTARAGKYLQFNSTTGNPEAGPDSTDVTTLADIATDIATLADIEDGTDATDAIQTVAGISANVTTVAGIASNVSTVAGISSAVSSVAADATDIGTVATNIASVNTVAGNITEVIAVANDLNEAVSEVETVANDLNEAVSEIETVAASITNVDTVGTNISNVNTVAGIDSNVTTVAGISGNVTTVAGISGNVTTVAGISADVTTVAADGTDIGTVATNISNVNTVAGISSNVTTVAGNNANVTTVASNIADVNTVAGSIADVNTFAVRYRIASSAPATSLDEGDLYFDTTDNQMYVYTGSAWVAVSPDLVADTTPQLGGNLDTNGNDITFGDGDKAIFGAGSDLSVYHSGTASYIEDTGTGNLFIRANDLRLQDDAGGHFIQGNKTSDVKIYHPADGTVHLATTSGGIDVTGTVTADGLTVDASNPTLQLTGGNVSLDFVSHAGTQNAESRIYAPRRNTSDSSSYFFIQTNDATSTRNSLFINGGTNDVSLYDSSGVTQGFYWDASTQALGLGTTSPDSNYKIHVNGNSNTDGRIARFSQDGTDNAIVDITAQDGTDTEAVTRYRNDATYYTVGIDSSDNFAIGQSFANDIGNKRFVITSGGSVGIGTAAPSTVNGLSKGGTHLMVNDDSGGARLNVEGSTDARFHMVDTGASANQKTYLTMVDGGNYTISLENDSGTASERLRLDSSGNLLVGTTGVNPHNVGQDAGVALRSDGRVLVGVDGDIAAAFNRNTTDGDIVLFKKDGTTVGAISTASGRIAIGTNDTALFFNDLGDAVVGWNMSTGVSRGSAIDLGTSGVNFKDLYLSGGVYLGGTGSSNLLDDYEEGTWTPALTATGGGATIGYSSQVGKYIKVGGLVTVWCRITLSSVSGGSGDAKVSGLPFSVENTEAMRGNSHVMLDQLAADRRQTSIQADPNATTLGLIRDSGSTSSHLAVPFSDMTANTDVRFQYSYRTS